MSRKRYSAEQWCAWFEEHLASGLTVEQFCRSKGTTANTFYKWRRRLAQELSEVELSGARGAGSAKKEPPATAFVSVVTSTAISARNRRTCVAVSMDSVGWSLACET